MVARSCEFESHSAHTFSFRSLSLSVAADFFLCPAGRQCGRVPSAGASVRTFSATFCAPWPKVDYFRVCVRPQACRADLGGANHFNCKQESCVKQFGSREPRRA